MYLFPYSTLSENMTKSISIIRVFFKGFHFKSGSVWSGDLPCNLPIIISEAPKRKKVPVGFISEQSRLRFDSSFFRFPKRKRYPGADGRPWTIQEIAKTTDILYVLSTPGLAISSSKKQHGSVEKPHTTSSNFTRRRKRKIVRRMTSLRLLAVDMFRFFGEICARDDNYCPWRLWWNVLVRRHGCSDWGILGRHDASVLNRTIHGRSMKRVFGTKCIANLSSWCEDGWRNGPPATRATRKYLKKTLTPVA